MKKLCVVALLLLFAMPLPIAALGREAKLVRYPHYYKGRIAFTYLGDIWTADESGKDIHRLTVNPARDVFPRFSPDGKWIAFSSDRNGNLDVFLLPVEGGTPKQLTFHSADDTVLGWTPDSRAVLFASNRGEDFMTKLYTVSIEGGLPRPAGPDMGIYASYSPDGTKLAVNRKSQVYWRKYYRGANQSDVTVMDLAARKFTDLTDFNGMDAWPMWSRDGHIYFVSDREGGGLTNIWRVPERGGTAERVTAFTTGDVRWPAMSADGKTIVFEHDFGIWKLDLPSRKVTPIHLEIAAETEENSAEIRDFNSQVDDYDLAPTGRRIAFSIHGELFTAPAGEGDVVQLTDSPARDQDPHYSPDGKSIAYISDRSGREEIYVAAPDGAGAPLQLTNLDQLKETVSWSPDSKAIAFTTSDNRLLVADVQTRKTTELAASTYGGIGTPSWSPDGKWIAFAQPDRNRVIGVYLIPASGGTAKKMTFDAYSDSNPMFSPDGRKLYFIRGEGGDSFGAPPVRQLYAITLQRETSDPSEAGDLTDPSDPTAREGEAPAEPRPTRRTSPANSAPPKEVVIDWSGLKRRTRPLTPTMSVFSFAITPDSRTIVFVASEGGGRRGASALYSIQETGRGLTLLSSAAAPTGEDAAPDEPRGFRGGISTLRIARDGRTLFFKEGNAVYSMSLSGGAGGGGGAGFAGTAPRRGGGFRAAAASDGASAAGRRRISFDVKVKIDHPAEWAEMFDDAWRTMKYRFYDPRMHGKDWDAARAKYRPLVAEVGDRHEVLNLINEMIGELNASHTGAAPPPQGRAGGVETSHLGVELEPDQSAGRYRVTTIYEDGPADKDWVKVSVGNYLIAINGKPVKAGDNYWQMLNSRLNRKVEVTFNDKPVEEGAWKTRIEPVSIAAYSQLRYERWVKDRRETVDRLSSGRVGYLHIKAMDPPSLRRFERELRANRDREALIIDERWNGGGNIEQELLSILVQRPYEAWQPRGTEMTPRPFAGFFGPKVVLQNWRSASNAEMFPAGFRALGLGKVVGTPTYGAVIGTGSYSLIDGSTVRTPAVGVYLADPKHTNMENYGVQPDILVENTPEDNLKGYDRQLETAVQELLKQIGPRSSIAKGN